MKNKLSVFLNLSPVQLKQNNQTIVQICKAYTEKEVRNVLFEGEYISLVLSSKLRKRFHFQALAFNIIIDRFHEYKCEYCHQCWHYERLNSVLCVHFIKLEIYPHANLSFDAVFRKISFQLLREWENSIRVSDISYQRNPVKIIEKL